MFKSQNVLVLLLVFTTFGAPTRPRPRIVAQRSMFVEHRNLSFSQAEGVSRSKFPS